MNLPADTKQASISKQTARGHEGSVKRCSIASLWKRDDRAGKPSSWQEAKRRMIFVVCAFPQGD